VIAEARQERQPDGEIFAATVLVRSLLAQGRAGVAEKEIKQAEALTAHSENRLESVLVAIVAAQVKAARGQNAEALAQLKSALEGAGKMGLVPYQFEARLAIGQMEIKSGKAVAGRAHLAGLQKDAGAKGFLLVARQAGAHI